MKLKIKLTGLEKGERITLDKAKHILMQSMFKLEEVAIQKAPFDQGEIRQKISLFPQVLADHYVLTSGAGHSAVMEYGSIPFYAPIDPLLDWAGRKFGDESIGWAVRYKISVEGITAQPYMRPALIEVKDFWMPQFAKAEFK